MTMQTRQDDEAGLPAQNFTVLSLQRRLFARSNIGVIAVNKESPSGFSDTLPVNPSTNTIETWDLNITLHLPIINGRAN
jgi:hypothetical protein